MRAQLFDSVVRLGNSIEAEFIQFTMVHVWQSGTISQLAPHCSSLLENQSPLSLPTRQYSMRVNPEKSIDGKANVAHKTSCYSIVF